MKTMIGFSNGKTVDIKMSEQIQAVEVRKRRAQWSRISLSWAIVGTFIFLVYLLFFADIKEDSKDLVNILVGAFIFAVSFRRDWSLSPRFFFISANDIFFLSYIFV